MPFSAMDDNGFIYVFRSDSTVIFVYQYVMQCAFVYYVYMGK